MPPTAIPSCKAHIAIHVRNFSESLAFYKKLFGAEPSKLRTGYAKFDLASPPLNFTLNQSAAPFERGALSHLGIQVETTADVLAMRGDWEQRGLQPRDEMQTECCYALQDKAWVQDPDGNEWEVFAVLKDHLPEKAAAGQSCCGPDCCAPVAP